MSLALNDEHRQIVRRIVAAHLPAGANVRVFGSRAKGAPRPHSDLDLAFETSEGLTQAELANLAEAFSESDLPFKVDIVDLHSASPTLRAAIDRDGIDLNP